MTDRSDCTVTLSSLPEAAVVVDAAGEIVARNDAARVLDRLFVPERRGPLLELLESARLHGVARATWSDPSHDRSWSVSATGVSASETLVLLVDLRPAVVAEREATLGGLVHDLRNMAFGLALTAEGIADADPDERAEAVRGIVLTTKRLHGLVGVLEDWIRPLEDSPASYPLRLLVGQVVTRLGRPSRVSIVGDASAELHGEGRGQVVARALELVLRHAIAHAPVDGDVSLEISPGEPRHVITVRAPRVAKASLVPAHRIRLREVDANLGLVVASRLVVDDGGELETVRDDEGGARFCLFVPASKARC